MHFGFVRGVVVVVECTILLESVEVSILIVLDGDLLEVVVDV